MRNVCHHPASWEGVGDSSTIHPALWWCREAPDGVVFPRAALLAPGGTGAAASKQNFNEVAPFGLGGFSGAAGSLEAGRVEIPPPAPCGRPAGPLGVQAQALGPGGVDGGGALSIFPPS